MKYIDLHSHSTASDGTDTPAELVLNASRLGLAALALTDHDTVAGLDEAGEAARDLDIEFVRGCEISAATSQGNVHILALWLPAGCEPLESFLARLREGRDRRNDMILERLHAAGVNITIEELRHKAGGSIGRPHMAALLVEKGYAENLDEAFREWLSVNGRAYVPKPAPTPAQALRIIRGLGASAILAHPLLRPKPEPFLENLVSSMTKEGLFGLEAWHSSCSPEQTEQIISLAQKYGLALSGGSDYHGANKPGIRLGSGKSNLAIGIDVLRELKKRRQALGLPC